ncbi:MAG TPA: hypothetical protein VN030_07530 [Cellvibrio sp.]|nr:hypothetical protein [Cellvibrio sp.]
MKNRLDIFLRAVLIACCCLSAVAREAIAGDSREAYKSPKTFYRYVNEEGSTVVAQTIPPKYVRAGYEIITLNGEVVKRVAPAPSEADRERVNQEKIKAKEQARADLQLHRSYSNVKDIEAAKERNLLELNNNIKILQVSLQNVKAQLKEQEAHAAATERGGRKTSDEVLTNIKTLRQEEKEVGLQIKQREQELKLAADKYDQDRQRFIEITKPQ